MKKISFTLLILVLLMGVAAVSAGGPWVVKVEGNGYASGGALPDYGVKTADIGWNMKLNGKGEVKGQLNIVEKMIEGKPRHFKLSGDELLPLGDPTEKPIVFDCDALEVRVEGTNKDGYTVSAHFRSPNHPLYPNSIWYWVKDSDGNFVTSTLDRVLVSDPITLYCAE